MRQGSNGRRPRGRPHRKQHGGGSPRGNNFDSNGPEGRIRGNAHQVYERYLALARDAVTSGDRVAAETYHQHAEHYFRIVNSTTDPQPNGQGDGSRQGANGQGDNAAGQNRAEARGPDNGQDRGSQPVQAKPRPEQEPTAEPDPQPKEGPSKDGADDKPAGD